MRYNDADGRAPQNIYDIYTSGKINITLNNDKTDTFNMHNQAGEQISSYTMNKHLTSNDIELVEFPKSGDSWNKTADNREDYIQPQVAAAIIGASANYKETTGNSIQINQLTDYNGNHSLHPGNGVMADVRYAKDGGKIERFLTGGSNFDKASSQLLVDNFRKFGFNKPLSIFTENSMGNGPALSNTHFPSNTFNALVVRGFSHQHHMHLNIFNPSGVSLMSDPHNYPLITPHASPGMSTRSAYW